MNQQKLKNKIVKSIKQLDNELLLAEIYDMLNTDLALNEEVYQLSVEQKQAVEEGCRQVDSGNFLTDEEANRQID